MFELDEIARGARRANFDRVGRGDRICGAMLGAALVLILAAPSALAGAGSELEIPVPQGQASPPAKNGSATVTIPRINPQNSAPPPGMQTETIPGAPLSAPQSTLEIPLPREFRGCWRGEVARLDSMRMLSGPRVSEWIAKTYRICYVQSAGGPFQLRLSETGLAGIHRSLTNVKEIMKVISTDGRTTARMRALLHFDEPAGSLFGMFKSQGSVDELTNMSCRIDGDVMHVEAKVYAQWNGRPWSEMTWHADFRNVPE